MGVNECRPKELSDIRQEILRWTDNSNGDLTHLLVDLLLKYTDRRVERERERHQLHAAKWGAIMMLHLQDARAANTIGDFKKAVSHLIDYIGDRDLTCEVTDEEIDQTLEAKPLAPEHEPRENMFAECMNVQQLIGVLVSGAYEEYPHSAHKEIVFSDALERLWQLDNGSQGI